MDQEIYDQTVRSMLEDPRVLQMAKFPHHVTSNTLSHSIYVTKVAGKMAALMNLDVHESDLARGCMLHDFYLYSTSDMEKNAYQHGTQHAEIALENADKQFDLTDIEKDVIYSHMWPLNISHVPQCKESALICIADKYCAIREFLHIAPVFKPAVAV